MRWPRAALLAALATMGCAGRRATAPVAMPGAIELADEIADRAAHAITADARLERADSLYAPDAELIADGARRVVPPRYAGVSDAGQVSIGSSRVEVSGAFAWVVVEYRWFSAGQDLFREARATILFGRQPDGRWRISHAHSSTAR